LPFIILKYKYWGKVIPNKLKNEISNNDNIGLRIKPKTIINTGVKKKKIPANNVGINNLKDI